jgi:hypothetical protein
VLVLPRRLGYPAHAFHPNSMVLTLTGAGLLWFGWFGFNGGSATAASFTASSAFAATQAAAAAAGLSWMLVEWLHKGKPTALGLASGIVAGLVAVTPASGFVYAWGGLAIGAIAGVVCYGAVLAKGLLKYDDSLDAFGVHGVGGFLGAVLTGVFCYKGVQSLSADGLLAGNYGQFTTQVIAAGASVGFAFAVSLALAIVCRMLGMAAASDIEKTGLDQAEHGEAGFDLSPAEEFLVGTAPEPKAAKLPPGNQKRFEVVVEGIENGGLIKAWSEMCQPGRAGDPDFQAVYPYVTTVSGNRFRFRGGDPKTLSVRLQNLFTKAAGGSPVRVRVEA